ncbi:MAG: hypothetical protein LQ348_000758 [Seirophora lacunosa]|nr:MAG: hypothetical protein LQ348_000758 [Seirophora lacunosa]
MENHSPVEEFLIEGVPLITPISSDLLIRPLAATTVAKPFPLTSPPPHCPNHIVRRKGPETVTETVSITISVFDVSVLVESHFLTLTDTVYINKTVFQPVFHTAHHTHTLTLNHSIPTTVLATATLPLPATILEQATLRPVPPSQTGKLGGVAVAGIVVGGLVGAAALMALAWVAVRRYRNWKARKNQHMMGVELQRRWEMEQEDRRETNEIEGGRGA